MSRRATQGVTVHIQDLPPSASVSEEALRNAPGRVVPFHDVACSPVRQRGGRPRRRGERLLPAVRRRRRVASGQYRRRCRRVSDCPFGCGKRALRQQQHGAEQQRVGGSLQAGHSHPHAAGVPAGLGCRFEPECQHEQGPYQPAQDGNPPRERGVGQLTTERIMQGVESWQVCRRPLPGAGESDGYPDHGKSQPGQARQALRDPCCSTDHEPSAPSMPGTARALPIPVTRTDTRPPMPRMSMRREKETVTVTVSSCTTAVPE